MVKQLEFVFSPLKIDTLEAMSNLENYSLRQNNYFRKIFFCYHVYNKKKIKASYEKEK